MSGKTNLFVYGTLKRGGRNHWLVAGGRFQGEAVTMPRYRVYDLDEYPALIEDETGGLTVRGEVWAVDVPTLAALDEFEEVPDLFARRLIAMAGPDRAVQAYFYNRSVPAGTPSGDRWPTGKGLSGEYGSVRQS